MFDTRSDQTHPQGFPSFTFKADLQHGQVPDPSTTDAFILEVQRGLDGSRLKFDLEDLDRNGCGGEWGWDAFGSEEEDSVI